MKKIKELLIKYKELITYVIFGVLTTVVNFAAFWIIDRILGDSLYLISNAIAWVIAVAFAYVTNKIWVFESKSWAPKLVLKEVCEFVAARLFSFSAGSPGRSLTFRTRIIFPASLPAGRWPRPTGDCSLRSRRPRPAARRTQRGRA